MPGEEPLTTPGRVSLWLVAAEWARLGCIGFGGPPAHIALLRRLCVQRRRWIPDDDFEDGIAATNLLPGPASTQLAIYCAWRLRGLAGGLVGGVCFITPGLVAILALSVLLLGGHPPAVVLGAAAGTGAAVVAVALRAGADLVPASRRRAGDRGARGRWWAYLIAGGLAAAVFGPWLVLVLLGCGLVETAVVTRGRTARPGLTAVLGGAAVTGWAALAWTALKVGALSYGGGFVIIPLMRADAVERHHWMTGTQFLLAVALGQITPGPVVQTVAVVGYAAAGVTGGLLAAAIAFAPSFVFVLAGGRYFDRLRASRSVQSFLGGAGPAAVGAIFGTAVPLALTLGHLWQVPVLAAAGGYLLVFRGRVVPALLVAGLVGAVAVGLGLPVDA